MVVFLSGGPGAGKTTSTKTEVNVTPRLVIDTILEDFHESLNRIHMALKAAKQVTINFVYREPVEAFEKGVVSGMLDPSSDRYGRTMPIPTHVNAHFKSLETIKKLSKEFSGNSRIIINAFDNRYGPGMARKVKVANLPEIPYTEEELTVKLSGITEKLYKNGTITRDQYLGLNPAGVPEAGLPRQGIVGQTNVVPRPQTAKTSEQPGDRAIKREGEGEVLRRGTEGEGTLPEGKREDDQRNVGRPEQGRQRIDLQYARQILHTKISGDKRNVSVAFNIPGIGYAGKLKLHQAQASLRNLYKELENVVNCLTKNA